MGHPARRKRQLVRFNVRFPRRRRMRIPRGPVGLFFLAAHLVIPVFYLMVAMAIGTVWLIVAGTQVTCWGVADLIRLVRPSTPGLPQPTGNALTDFQRMTPLQFEHALASLCQRDGCTSVRVVGGAGDLGADVIATTPDGRRIVIQAKRYAAANRVGSPEVQKVGGTYYVVHGAHLAAVVTTSGFTQAAVQYARQAGIRLYGARELAGWVSRTGPAPWH
ncbi:restriction endonuclease [Streptacidiphilus neutrinimicus]|uniref:restriction endonuclease n=1 Tax=Streptacidiphilus neutrinimicus TaxID=105420 RepID=UPI001F4561CE|nr:restriction endonuclease [Streptacidiphilus neutrinimicus]